ncbi:MAG TPA: hypothetical protein VMP42_04210 [Actinomycetota bacterium]|nr:hypothetical protein [Actinomycetota bacterium]
METSPLTLNRAATAVVRSRTHLEAAQEELRLALRILADGPASETALEPPERLALLRRLERYLERVREAQEVAGTVWRGHAGRRPGEAEA